MHAPSPGYASSPSAMRYEHQPPSDNRPKLFMEPHPMQPPYGHFMNHGIPHHTPIKYEPSPYLPPPSSLHVSSDYQPPSDSSTPSNAKRSREELNKKEKQRMSKLNERISQLRELLDAAGVHSKKNKQSVLDNTVHLITQLQAELKIAQQQAERAERQADSFRARGGRVPAEKTSQCVFEGSSTPRVVMDLKLHTVAFNPAFVMYTGLTESTLKKKKSLRHFLCADQEKLDKIVDKLYSSKKSIGVQVKTCTTGAGTVSVNLVAALVTNDSGEATNIEFSLIPLEVHQTKRRKIEAMADKETADGDSTAIVEESAMYVQL